MPLLIRLRALLTASGLPPAREYWMPPVIMTPTTIMPIKALRKLTTGCTTPVIILLWVTQGTSGLFTLEQLPTSDGLLLQSAFLLSWLEGHLTVSAATEKGLTMPRAKRLPTRMESKTTVLKQNFRIFEVCILKH